MEFASTLESHVRETSRKTRETSRETSRPPRHVQANHRYRQGARVARINPPSSHATCRTASSDFTSSPLDIGADGTRFFCTYHLAG